MADGTERSQMLCDVGQIVVAARRQSLRPVCPVVLREWTLVGSYPQTATAIQRQLLHFPAVPVGQEPERHNSACSHDGFGQRDDRNRRKLYRDLGFSQPR
jgi:hypothetical protein